MPPLRRGTVEIPEDAPPVEQETRRLVNLDVFGVTDALFEHLGGLLCARMDEVLVNIDDKLFLCILFTGELVLIFRLHSCNRFWI